MQDKDTKFHPILFSTPMVQAILEGRKTLTRRTKGLESINENPDAWDHVGIMTIGNTALQKFRIYQWFEEKATGKHEQVKCPYELDDVLWVRERFANDDLGFHYYAGNVEVEENRVFRKLTKWKPSIHMPKKNCRLFLKIKSIRIERLQDISEEDAIQEGVEKIADYGSTGYRLYTEPEASYSDIDAIYSFESLWISIDKEESWKQNPFVWVYEFEQIEKPLDFIV